MSLNTPDHATPPLATRYQRTMLAVIITNLLVTLLGISYTAGTLENQITTTAKAEVTQGHKLSRLADQEQKTRREISRIAQWIQDHKGTTAIPSQ